MKLIFRTIIYIIFLSFFSCSQKHDTQFDELNSLISSNPQRGLNTIKQLKQTTDTDNEYTIMMYELLNYKGEELLGLRHSSDSTIFNLYKYFNAYGDNSCKIDVNHLVGNKYKDLYNYPLASVYYNNAIKTGECTQMNGLDSSNVANCHLELSKINHKMNRPWDALTHSKKAFGIKGKNNTESVLDYQNLANSYYACNITDSASIFYKKSALTITAENTIAENSDIIAEQLSFFLSHGDNEMSKWSLNQLQCINTDSLSSFALSVIADYQLKECNNIDSASYYYNKAYEKAEDALTKAMTAHILSTLNTNNVENSALMEYTECYMAYIDSVITNSYKQRTLTHTRSKTTCNAAQCTQDIYTFNNLESYYQDKIQSLEEIIDKTQTKSNKLTAYAICSTFFFVVLIAFIIQKNDNKITEYISSIDIIKKDNSLLEEKNWRLEEMAKADNALRTENADDITAITTNLKGICKDFKAELTENMWNDIYSAVDKIHPSFRNHILSYYPEIENKDLILVYLLFINIKQADLARLFNISPTAISRKIKRISEKTGVSMSDIIDRYKNFNSTSTGIEQ